MAYLLYRRYAKDGLFFVALTHRGLCSHCPSIEPWARHLAAQSLTAFGGAPFAQGSLSKNCALVTHNTTRYDCRGDRRACAVLGRP